jgi:hypothetical protein
LKNYLRCRYGVKNGLKCSFTARKLGFGVLRRPTSCIHAVVRFSRFCLVSAPSPTFFNGLLRFASVQAAAMVTAELIL